MWSDSLILYNLAVTHKIMSRAHTLYLPSHQRLHWMTGKVYEKKIIVFLEIQEQMIWGMLGTYEIELIAD